MKATMVVPNDTAIAGDFFYVLLSIWDSAGSYDQVGFTSDYGVWGWTWSWTSYCGGSYHFNPDAVTLNPSNTYTFFMTDYANGSVDFQAYYLTGPPYQLVGNHWASTGGLSFIEQGTYSCNGNSYYDYTDYEEVYSLAQQNVPNWSFFFINNSANSGSVTTWSGFTQGSPSIVDPYNSGGTVTVANEHWRLSFTNPVTVPLGGERSYLSHVIALACAGSSCNAIYLSVQSVPSGIGISFSPESGTPTFNPYINIWGNVSNLYYIRIIAQNVNPGGPYNGYYTTFRLEISVYTGGGGGCVASGTPILTPSGYVPIQKLAVGSTVMEFNFTTGALQFGTLWGANATISSSLVEINGGLLTLTSTDQPVYIKNGTFVGWLRDPQNLSVGDQLFDAQYSTWIVVSSLTFLTSHVRVFDVVTSGMNVFIANGILLDRKP